MGNPLNDSSITLFLVSLFRTTRFVLLIFFVAVFTLPAQLSAQTGYGGTPIGFRLMCAGDFSSEYFEDGRFNSRSTDWNNNRLPEVGEAIGWNGGVEVLITGRVGDPEPMNFLLARNEYESEGEYNTPNGSTIDYTWSFTGDPEPSGPFRKRIHFNPLPGEDLDFPVGTLYRTPGEKTATLTAVLNNAQYDVVNFTRSVTCRINVGGTAIVPPVGGDDDDGGDREYGGGVDSGASNIGGNPLDDEKLVEFLTSSYKVLFDILFVFLIIYFVIVGYLFVLARGDLSGLEVAKKNLKYALISGFALFGAWVVGEFIVNMVKLIIS